ncbi:MAG: hypothetical protein V1708_00020 [Candidatus Micrarchaeota archaeon]
MELSFEALRKIQLQERNFGALSALSDDFYEAYTLWILESQRALAAGFTIERMKAYENSKKIIDEIRQKREQKILLKALKDHRGGAVSSEGLAREEKALYLCAIGGLEEFEKNAAAAINPAKPKAMPIAVEPASTTLAAGQGIAQNAKEMQELQSVKFLMGIPQFVGTDGNAYGPYDTGQVAAIKREVAEILVRKGAAEPCSEECIVEEEIGGIVEKMDSGGESAAK